MSLLRRIGGCAAAVLAFAGLAQAVLAAPPRNWQMNLNEPASPTMERIVEFHNLLLVVITLISVFVLALLLYVMFRFSEKRNPTPSKTTHNTVLEVLWTTIPVIILVIIAIPSFKLLYYADRVENADMTLKAIGRQWYWSYEYPDNGNFTFDSVLVADEDLEDGQPRLLTPDNMVVVPVNTKVRLLVTASDVLHSFALPALGVKLDAVPGRINETWFEVTREGTYYGQCSEICGTGHAYMPIAVKAVSKAEFERWVAKAKEEFARVDAPEATTHLAQVGTQSTAEAASAN
ncbi:MAG: cytochrome c oxidase subunit II [Alphaproteobacteria bacterium]|nr:MAG: cytochrome c oxidase subunit II [Alphaproteobacteria bacterium]